MNTTNANDWIMGIDIGGSHITAAMIDLTTGAIVNEVVIRKHVDCHAPADAILTNWCNVIREVWSAFDLKSSRLGFAMPGPFDYAGGISLIKGFAKYEALYQMDIRAELAGRLDIPGEDILFRNDAEAFLEGELNYGAAKGYTHAIGITLGTGLGSASSHAGVTVNSELSTLPYKGERIEDYVSTRGLIRTYEQLSGEKLTNAKLIAERYASDENAAATFRSFGEHLTWFLHYFIEREQPEVLVIGGNIANSWSLFSAALEKSLSATVAKMPVISIAKLGEHAALIGGACCFVTPAISSGKN